MRSYQHILRAATEAPWCILETKLVEIAAMIEEHLNGDPEVMRRRLAKFESEMESEPESMHPKRPKRHRSSVQIGDIGIVAVHGTMLHRVGGIERMSGAVSTPEMAQQVSQFAEDPAIKGILLDIDSPGGQTVGTQELADAIAAAAKIKPVFANANGVAASAAFWIGTQATEFTASPSAMVGSIGVIWIHTDNSKALEAAGQNITIIQSGKFKSEGHPFGPLTDEGRANMQEISDKINSDFVRSVARGRGTTSANVNSTFGQGRVFLAKDALALGMIDRVEPIGRTMSRLMRRIELGAPEGGARSEIKTERDFESFLREAGGFSRAEATGVASLGYKAMFGSTIPAAETPREAAESKVEESDEGLSEALKSFTESVEN